VSHSILISHFLAILHISINDSQGGLCFPFSTSSIVLTDKPTQGDTEISIYEKFLGVDIMNVKQYFRHETPEVIYEIYMSIAQISDRNTIWQRKMDIYEPLGRRAIVELGCLERVYDVIKRMESLLYLESRFGNIRNRYPHLKTHEIVELLYSVVTII